MDAPPDSQFPAGMFLGRAALPPRVLEQPFVQFDGEAMMTDRV